MNDTLIKIAEQIKSQGGTAYFVGGCVRDEVMGIPCNDFDIEVFGLDANELKLVLSRFGQPKLVGQSFGVFKITIDGIEFDFSLPRTESKNGVGNGGFDVSTNKNLSIKEAASRRDFTLNAIYKNVLTGELIDKFNGLCHINQEMIIHTSNKFGEDSLRVLRAMQFAGRFDFDLSPKTAIICRELGDEFHALPKERLWVEFEKLFRKSIKPSMGIEVLQQTDWIDFFPEIADLEGLKQDTEWHPEGDVLTHTKLVMDEAARLSNSSQEQLINVLAALCHDMGKPITTEVKDGRIVSPKHAKKGVDVAIRFMERINTPNAIKDKVVELVREHMIHVGGSITKRTARRLIHRMKHATINELMILIEADHSGRPPKSKGFPVTANMIKEFAAEIGDEIKPILMGRHLIERGMKPCKQFGIILHQAEQAQLDGVFDELQGALLWLNEYEFNNN